GEFVRLIAAIRNGVIPDEDNAALPALRQGGVGHWRVFAGVVLAAGIRPCSGAIILLVFSLSQGLFAAGVVGALAMAIGTSITTGTLASLTVFAKAVVKRLTSGGGMTGPIAFAGFELLAAAVVAIGFMEPGVAGGHTHCCCDPAMLQLARSTASPNKNAAGHGLWPTASVSHCIALTAPGLGRPRRRPFSSSN